LGNGLAMPGDDNDFPALYRRRRHWLATNAPEMAPLSHP
jgi:hypothetical protein